MLKHQILRSPQICIIVPVAHKLGIMQHFCSSRRKDKEMERERTADNRILLFICGVGKSLGEQVGI